jgi:hypothetical protein
MGLSKADVITRLRDACQALGSENAWAKAHGMSQTYVFNVLRGRREPAERILLALGLRRRVIYEPIEGAAE